MEISTQSPKTHFSKTLLFRLYSYFYNPNRRGRELPRESNPVIPKILEPDLVAPGIDILAAWTGHTRPTSLKSDKRIVEYNIMSVTSMSFPHVTGIAALIRAAYPDWTPAAIKSALMTSSMLFDNTKRLIQDSFTNIPANAFAIGAGHVNPSATLNLGLFYDAGFDDYVSFLCSLNYTRSQIHILTRTTSSCTNLHPQQPADLNYPSFSVVFKPRNLVRVTRRSVTNVGGDPSIYEIAVEIPPNVSIIVETRSLAFKMKNEKASFTVRFERKITSDKKSSGHHEFGQVSWKCVEGGTQVVHSLVAIA